jgi:DNA-binding MarR family transcriptional regulator
MQPRPRPHLRYVALPDPATVDLTPGAYLLYGVLQVGIKRGKSGELMDQELAAAVHRSEGSVQRHLRQLERAGLIERHRRHGRRSITVL